MMLCSCTRIDEEDVRAHVRSLMEQGVSAQRPGALMKEMRQAAFDAGRPEEGPVRFDACNGCSPLFADAVKRIMEEEGMDPGIVSRVVDSLSPDRHGHAFRMPSDAPSLGGAAA